MQSLMSQHVQPHEQGALQGAVGSMRGIAGMLGPIVMTGIFTMTAGSKAWIELPGAVYFLAATLVVAAMATAWFAVTSKNASLKH
jgi:MFS transporter, DHA1 family, tetracycline resistance protein